VLTKDAGGIMKMKKFFNLVVIFVIVASLISFSVLGQTEKWIRESEIQPRISDAAGQSEILFANFQTTWYFDGAMDDRAGFPEDGWVRSWIRNSGSRFGCRNWRDPETGGILPIKLGGSPYGTSDESCQFAVPDSFGITIHMYYRYHPPAIVVDGLHIERDFPRIGDHYAPDSVWGTADVMVTSHARNWLGLDIYQRVLGWVSHHHNQYVIYDWTIVNTGNVDLDDSIEREGESLDSLYFMRQLEMTVNSENEKKAEWYTWTGVYTDWVAPRDSVRCMISYPDIDFLRSNGPDWIGDAVGCYLHTRDYLDDATSGCEAYLYVPQSPAVSMGPGADYGNPDNHPETDDVTQPRSHGRWGPDDLEFKEYSGIHPAAGENSWETVYNSMIYGEKGDPEYDPYVEYMTGTYPNTYHPVPPDRRWYVDWNDQTDELPTKRVYWHAVGMTTMGPFDLDFGDSLRIVWADCGGRLSEQSCWDVGHKWKDSTITFVTQSGDTLDINDITDVFPHLPNAADTIHIPPIFRHHPERWHDNPQRQTGTFNPYWCDRANLLKDMWVYSTVDSTVRHAINAQWNFDHDYMAPVPPPPPSIEVKSQADQIAISWSYEYAADIASDLAGFKVYRSVGRAGPLLTNDAIEGVWTLIFQCGGSDPGGSVEYNSSIVYEYSDTTAVRGENYYYYVASFDDGTHPETTYPDDVTGTSEVLESGRWQNYTYGVVGAATIKRAGAANLSNVRVVPNPYNFASQNMMYQGGDKINFFGLTEKCTIRIYTLTGDLVKTFEHTDGSGDETWVNPTKEIYQVTEFGQHVVSGLYIANIVDNVTGESTNVKFVVIR
jgi:hypothetical protein